jgi:hypothetical protein
MKALVPHLMPLLGGAPDVKTIDHI